MTVEEMLAEVADELTWLTPPPVFIGGATISLFLDEFGRAQARTTRDVDCIVPGVATRQAWFALEAELRSRGWQPDPEGPICRYRSPRGHRVDLLGARPEVQGFSGRWFEAAAANAEARLLDTRRSVLTPRVAWLTGCKVEAFRDRGAADPLASADLEDLVALVDGCADWETAVCSAPAPLRPYIAEWAADVLGDASLLAAADGQLPRGGDIVGRRRRLRERLGRVARLRSD